MIVGSGFEQLGFEVLTRSPTKTPYGEPSSPVLTVAIRGVRVACIARHGESHEFAPHEINYRANLWALEQRGVRACIGVNTVGAIDRGVRARRARGARSAHRLHARPRVDVRRRRRSRAAHRVRRAVLAGACAVASPTAIADCGFGVRAGTYGVTQGPRLETAAEIERLARDGCAMVGMTAMPEAALARELDIDYAICAVAVNYAAGRSPDGAPIGGQIERFTGVGLAKVRAVLERFVAGTTDAM